MQEIASMPERVHAMEEFLETDPDFMCGYGRHAMRQGRVHIEPLADTPDFLERTHAVIEALQQGFAQKEKDACIFVFPDDRTNHWLEYFRTWVMYATTHTAASHIHGEGSVEKLAPYAARKAEYFFSDPAKLGNDKEYVAHGKIPFGKGDQLMVMNTSTAYHDQHPRKTPVSAHIITRLSDASEARRGSIEMANAMLIDMIRKVRIPYTPVVPYVVPNDLRFAIPSFSSILPTLLILKERLPQIFTGDPIEIAKELCILKTKNIAMDNEGALFTRESDMDSHELMRVLIERNLISDGDEPA